MMRPSKSYLILLLTLLGYAGVRAQLPGTLDTNFSAVISSYPVIHSVILQSDGKVLVGGLFDTVDGAVRQNLVRLNTDGSLDTNFVNPVVNGTVWALGLATNGQVLVGGTFQFVSVGVRNDLAQLNTDGTVDLTFPNTTNNPPGANGAVYAIGFQPSDGKALVGGAFTAINSTNRNAIARLNPDGNPDPAFTSPLTNISSLLSVNALAVQSTDGKIIVGGTFRTTGSALRTNIARLNTSGTLDTNFNVRLGAVDSFTPGYIQSLALQSDGRILIGGSFTSVNGVARTNLARLNADGSLDTNFLSGLAGVNIPAAIGPAVVNAITPLDRGLILIGGWFTSVNGANRTNIARLNPDGSTDGSFDMGGAFDQQVNSFALQTNGYVIVGREASNTANATNAVVRLYAGVYGITMCDTVALPPGRTKADLDPANPPLVVPSTRTYWDAASSTLYPTNAGDFTVTWNFKTAPLQTTINGFILPLPTTTYNLTQEIRPPPCADLNQTPDTGGGAFWHNFSHKLYATAPGSWNITWKRPNSSLIPQTIVGQWPSNTSQFQIHVANTAPVDVTGGGTYGAPSLLGADASAGATLLNNLFAAGNAGRSLLMVPAAGAPAQATNIYFQLVQTILWNDPNYLRDTNTATIGDEIINPDHNPACGSPFALNYLPSFPARICVAHNFYDPTNRLGPVIPVNRSASGTRTNDLLLVMYQFGSRLKDPLTSNLLSNSVAWPYLPVRYLAVWPTNAERLFIAGGQGSGPVTLTDPNWSVYRQPNANQFGYNPNEEHAFRFAAAPPQIRVKLSASTFMLAEGDSVSAAVALVGDASYAPQSPVTVTISGARDNDTNLSVVFPTNVTSQQLLFFPSNWFVPQAIAFAAGPTVVNPSNSFFVRASGGLVSETLVQVLVADTNQPGLVADTLAFEVPEGTSKVVHIRLAQAPAAPVTVTTVNRGTAADSPILRVESGGTLIFNATNWNVPQTVSIHADPDANSINDVAVFNVQASGGLSANLAFTATQADTTGVADAVYALRNDLGDAFGTSSPQSSEPYVLLQYTNTSGIGRMKVYQVQAEDATHRFQSFQKAGQLLQAPNPLTTLPKCLSTVAVSGPYFRDRNGDHWAKAAGISNSLPAATNIILHYFYHPFPSASANGFDPPIGALPYSGNECLPWLDQYAMTPETPIDYVFTITWPDNIPQLRVGETLVKPKFGLPNIANQCSVDVIYEQTGPGTLVKLYDPLAVRVWPVSGLPGNTLPPEIVTQVDPVDQKLVFMQVPITLRKRLKFNPNTVPPQFEFGGYYNDTDYSGEPLLLPNVMTLADANALKALSANAVYRSAIDALRSYTVASATGVTSLGSQFKALSAASAQGQGYVALAMQNSGACGALPISVEIIQVSCPLYQGDIKPIYADCAFDETLTLRHSADFAGNGDNYAYEWFYRRVGDTVWIQDPTQTNQELTISGPGLKTLEDYQYYCHYRPISGGTLCGTGFSPDTQVQVAEGWIKRVLRGVNPFTQITSDFHATSVDTTANMIKQAGPRWEGAIALNCSPGNQFGLLQAYETVLRRGIDLSIGAGIPLTDDTALRLAAGQIADLYMLLGNEAYADAQDPTIGFGTDSGQFTASSIFCFQGQVTSLLQEELALLRGRDGPYGSDNSSSTRVDVAPVYNRLYWNFGPDPSGQTAYVLNYNITDQDASGTVDATDARILFPQGHGDAWGHYLSAIMAYYRLFSNPNYTWVPELEDVNINGVVVQVNYEHERKFAKIAAARARSAAEIVNLTYRSLYTEDPTGQWQGYRDSNTNRAWGVTEWGSRGGQAALFDWIVGNALLPALDTNSSPQQEVDRTTVPELREVAGSFLDLQQVVDNADQGLNPLGLDKNVVPFGIDPGALTTGQTHFDQIYGRAVGAMNNAVAVFNYANQPTQLLRKQQDALADFQRNVINQLADFTNRLIEIFGYPYNEDIGGGGAYSVGYTGPDLYHFNYVDVQQLAGVDPPTMQTVTLNAQDLTVAADGTLSKTTHPVTFNFATDNRALAKPPGFTTRLAPGDIQRALGDLIQARTRFQQGLVAYDNLISQIDDQAQLIQAQYGLNAQEVTVLDTATNTQSTLDGLIRKSRSDEMQYRDCASASVVVADAWAESLPTDAGFSFDPTSPARGALKLGGAALAQFYNYQADQESLAQMDHQQAESDAKDAANIQLTVVRQESALLGQIAQLQQLVRQEAISRYDMYNLREAVGQAAGNYLAILAKGNRLMEDRVRFLQETAAQVQEYRYKDMAFRIFRNDALQKYRAQFDLAARYVYLAAKAYDYETGLLQTSSKAGSAFLEDIVKKRAIGTIQNGIPISGSVGDSGLAAALAAMSQDYATIKANLGLNNQVTRQRLFSLRNGWFRIANASTNTTVWQQTLQRAIVNNIWDIPEFQRYCRPLRAQPADGHEPAIVIYFPSEIIAQDNFFGWPAGGGDSGYNASLYSTKILSVGIWFSSYDSSANGLVQYPSAWLVPIGEDVVRAAGANDFSYRHWKVFDQKIPVPNDFVATPPNFSLDWIPINYSLSGEFGAVGGQRQYSSIDATTESQSIPLDTTHIQTDSGLVGRSVWNTRWLLIIPGVSLLGSNPDEGLQRFIAGALVGGLRTGNGVTDIKVYFQTYSYSGF